MSTRGSTRIGLLVLALALATAACGSTVQTTAGGQPVSGLPIDVAGAVGGDGLSAPAGAVDGTQSLALSDATSDGTLVGGSSTSGATSGPAGAAGTASTGTAPRSAAAPATRGGGATGGAGANGPGVTAKELFIGIAYTANGDAANAALGASAITRGDEQANARAVIDDINEKGGVAGRKLVPVFHAYDAQSGEPSASQDQAACATFTDDNEVFAVTAGGLTDTFAACMKKAGVLQITSGGIIDPDAAFFAEFSTYFNVGTLKQERMMAELLQALSRQQYFSGWDATLARPATTKPKLGVLSIDTPSWNRPLDKVLLPGLTKLGHPVEPELVYRVHNPASQAEVSRTVADVQNATLRFRDAGVTHLVMLDANGSLTLLFSQNTRQQRYYPRLGANSATGMQALFDAGVLDPNQLAGAVGTGWLPTLDLPAGQGDKHLTPATKACLDNNRKRTGQEFTSTNAASIALIACDSIGAITAAARKAGPVLNLRTGLAAMESLGSSFQPAAIPKAFFGPQRHDGLELAFDLFWDSGCTCAKYRDPGHRVAS